MALRVRPANAVFPVALQGVQAAAMTTSLSPLLLRRVWGVQEWAVPQPFGPDGWSMRSKDGEASIIVSCASHNGADWVHASIAREDRMPDYADLVTLHRSVWKGRGWAFQVFAPDDDHVNIHERALHLWGRLDGRPVLPNFGAEGTI